MRRLPEHERAESRRRAKLDLLAAAAVELARVVGRAGHTHHDFSAADDGLHRAAMEYAKVARDDV